MSKKLNKRRTNFLRSLWRVGVDRYDVLFASLAINFLTLILPLLILQVYDKIIPNAAKETFALMVMGLAVVVVIDFVLRGLRSYITNWEGARFEHAISRRAVKSLVNSEVQAFENVPPGVHMDRIASIESLRDFHSGQGLIAVSDLPFVALFVTLIYLIGGNLVIAPLAVVLVAALFAMILGGRIESVVRQRTHLDDRRYNFVFQALNGIHTVKGLGLEAQIVRRYEDHLGELAGSVRKAAFLTTIGRSMGPVFSTIAMFSVAAVGSQMVIAGTLTGGSLIACTLLAGRAVQPLIRMIGVWVQSQNLKLSEERLDDLLTMDQEPVPAANESTAAALEGRISIKDVTVYRGRTDIPVLSNVNLEIPAGQVIAVTGALGSGKSAILELLAGLSRPDTGVVEYDGIDSTAINLQQLRREVGYVRQQAVLYRGTILDNLTKFQGRDALTPALALAHKLGLDMDIARMPKGLQTSVGDMASEGLARSVQQSIAIVRALAEQPRILLLEEANADLDMDTDLRFRNLIDELRGTCTVIMVTSRPSLIRTADRILHVDRGTVQEVTPGHAETAAAAAQQGAA